MARPRSTARDDLLQRVMEHVATHGIGDLSLRPLAEAIGTNHRMLLFHFGSKEELMVAVVRRVEAQQREAMAGLATRDDLSIVEQMQAHWQGLLAPELRNNIRLFFEVYADALRGRSYTKDFLDEVMSAWLPPVIAAIQPLSGAEHAPADARLMLALTRGLLLDLVTTDDLPGVEAAMQRFASLFANANPG